MSCHTLLAINSSIVARWGYSNMHMHNLSRDKVLLPRAQNSVQNQELEFCQGLQRLRGWSKHWFQAVQS